jgi:hypothetical protein
LLLVVAVQEALLAATQAVKEVAHHLTELLPLVVAMEAVAVLMELAHQAVQAAAGVDITEHQTQILMVGLELLGKVLLVVMDTMLVALICLLAAVADQALLEQTNQLLHLVLAATVQHPLFLVHL